MGRTGQRARRRARLCLAVVVGGVGLVGCEPKATTLECTSDGVVVHGVDGQPAAPGATPAATELCVVGPGANVTELSLVVDDDGDVYTGITRNGSMESAVMVSTNDGATWKRRVPRLDGQPALSPIMGWLVRDPDTGRLFGSSLGDPGCSEPLGDQFAWSDDDGASWKIRPDQLCNGGDWGKTFVGPAATDAGRARLAESGYPNVVYHCSGATGDLTRYCWRSYDGGDTFERTETNAISGGGPLADKGALRGPDPCYGETDFHQIAGQGVVAADGTIYMPVNACSYVSITKSTDEGATWSLLRVPVARGRGWYTHGGVPGFFDPFNAGEPTTPKQTFMGLYGPIAMANVFSQQLVVDEEGTLYLAWVNAPDQQLHLSVSSDGGTTWTSSPIVSPPGVQRSTIASIDVAEPGHIALAYYGSTDKQAYDGYVAESTDALAAQPTFTTAVVSPGAPLMPHRVGEPIESAGIDIAPDGSVWASFDRCIVWYPDDLTKVECDASLDYNESRYSLVVAHLR